MPDIPVRPLFSNMAVWSDWEKLDRIRAAEESA